MYETTDLIQPLTKQGMRTTRCTISFQFGSRDSLTIGLHSLPKTKARSAVSRCSHTQPQGLR